MLVALPLKAQTTNDDPLVVRFTYAPPYMQRDQVVGRSGFIVELAELIGEEIDVIAEHHARVQINTLPVVDGNLSQLTQLLQNIIANGIQYNKNEEPKISLDWSGVSEAPIVVTDNGIGIPVKFQKTTFMPLKRLWAVEHYEGHGLGLAICRKIVERHGGSIWCTSVEGEGSQFHILFPGPTAYEVATNAVSDRQDDGLAHQI